MPSALPRGPAHRIPSGESDRSHSPISRTGTPSSAHHHSNIAPQHLFDGVTLEHNFHSPTLPPFPRHPSPSSASSVNGSHLEPPPTYDALVQQNNTLRTRVSELEVINDLFRGRVAELESSEQEARRNLDEANTRETDLKRRISDLESELSELKGDGYKHKRVRMSDIIDESQTSTPLSTPSQS